MKSLLIKQILLFLLICRVASSIEDDPLDHEKLAMQEIEALAESIHEKDRMFAAERISAMQSRLTQENLIKKLINDPSLDVRRLAFRALNVVCSVHSFSVEEARKLGGELSAEITRNNIDKHFDANSSIKDTDMLIEKAAALNSLYLWYPLMSYVEFENWQRETYSYLAMRLIGNEKEIRGDRINLLMMLVNGLYEPEAINQVIPLLATKLITMPSSEMKIALRGLWKHPVLGNGRSMNVNLKLFLRPELTKLKERAELSVDSEFEIKEIQQILDSMLLPN